ncbi:MAG TPA: tetratricopeptide repeat protein, partial [Ignavibacteriaceae bacterium]|nr:tetratricopeptide repeat protein [Ignavibacteriaceae bacterium]
AQTDSKDKLDQAEQYYKSAQFDNAIEILNSLAADNSADIEVRKEALRFLGRAYSAKGLYDKAKEAIAQLLKLEPPMVVFNPDYEPPVFMKLYYESRKEFAGSYAVERPDPGMKTMAIIDFKNRSVDHKTQYDPMEQGFADLMINRLNNSTNLKVIERERIKWILDEIKLQNENDMEGAVRLGKQLGVQTVMLGSFIIMGDQIWLGARLVKVESSEILLTDEVKGDLDEFFDLVDQLGKKIADNINVTLKSDTAAAVSDAPSLDAIMAYSVGLSYLEKEDYKNAYEKFEEALKLDPNYEKAKLKAQSIAPLL